MKECTTMLKLKQQLDMDGTVVRYKDCVATAEFFADPHGEWFEVQVYARSKPRKKPARISTICGWKMPASGSMSIFVPKVRP